MQNSGPRRTSLASTITSRHFLPWLCGLTFVLACYLHFERGYFYNSPNYFHVTGSDDAYISYRYGWNLIHYNILAWNESGFRRTEGFTNPLWVYLSAAWSLTNNKDAVYPGVTFTSVVLTALVLIHLAYRVRATTSSDFSLAGMLLVSLSPVICSHTTSGMESGLFGAVLAWIAFTSIFDDGGLQSYLGIAVLLTVLLRSDGFVYVSVLLAALALTRSRYVTRVAFWLLLGVATLFLWRLWTFGSMTPNTAVAKLNFPWLERIGPGLRFLLISLPGTLPLLLLGVQGIRQLPTQRRIASGVVLAGWTAYYVYIGGDTYLERHLIGVMILLGCVACYQFDRLQLKRHQAIMSVGILLLFMYLPVLIGDSRFEYWKHKPDDPWILIGKEMAGDRERYGTVVVSAAGKIPFFAGGDFVDELGLNDPYLATQKRSEFIPGHASGNTEAAFRIAYARTQQYSYCSYGRDLVAADTNRVLLWIDNKNPQDGLHRSISSDDIRRILSVPPLEHTLLLQGAIP